MPSYCVEDRGPTPYSEGTDPGSGGVSADEVLINRFWRPQSRRSLSTPVSNLLKKVVLKMRRLGWSEGDDRPPCIASKVGVRPPVLKF